MANLRAQKDKDVRVNLTENGTESFEVRKRHTTTNETIRAEKKVLLSSGTPAANLGYRTSWYIEDDGASEDAADLTEMARHDVVMTTATDGSSTAEHQFWCNRAGVMTKILTIDGAATLATDGNLSFSTGRTVTILDNTDNAWSVVDSGGSPLTYLEFDSRDSAPLILVSQNLHIANNMDIIPATAGGNDLGSTSKEWGDIFIADGKSIKFGDAQDMAISWDATNLVITSVAADTGKVVLGVSDEGIDLQLFGATAGRDLLWDQSADSLIFNDNAKLQFGTSGGCATISAATTTLSILAVSDNNTIVIGAAGNSFDLKVFGASANYFFTFDTSANALKFEDDVFLDFGSTTAGVGTRGDFQFGFDGTQLNLKAAANNAIFKIGNGTESVDFWLYGSSNSRGVTWDASANALKLQDNDILYFGTGAAAGTANAGDISIKWNASKLVIDQLTANSAIDFGVSGAGIDVVLYGDTAGRDITWDQSADTLIVNDAAKIQFGTTAGCATISASTTTLSLLAVSDNNTIVIGAAGNGFDVKLFGADANGFLTWDGSANHLKLEDSVGLGFGSNTAGVGSLGDIVFKWDGTSLKVTQATADSSISWGIDGAGIDHIFYGDTASTSVTWDQSADSLIFTGAAPIVFTSTTGQSEIRLTDNLADALSVEISGSTDLLIFTTTDNAECVSPIGLRTRQATAVAITGATTLKLSDSGGMFTVDQGSAYDIDLPSPTSGAGCTYFFSLTAPAANNVTITVAGGAATFVGTIVDDNACVVATGSTLTFVATGVLGDNIMIRSLATNLYHVVAHTSGASKITIS